MKRHITAGLCILAVVASVGWKLASRPETSTGLQDISLIQMSCIAADNHRQAVARPKSNKFTKNDLSVSDFRLI